MKKKIIGLLFVLLFNGCSSNPIIKLDRLALTSKEHIEKKYLTHNYIKNMGGPEGVASDIYKCITKFPLKNKYFEVTSDIFLEIVVSSKDKILIDYKNNQGLGQGILIDGGIDAPEEINFCPLIEENSHRFIYTYFYPLKTKKMGQIGDIKKIKELKISISRTGSLANGITSAMHTNKIIITKGEIDELFDKFKGSDHK